MDQYAEAPPAPPSSPASDSDTDASGISLLVLFIVLISILSDEPRRRRAKRPVAVPLPASRRATEVNDYGHRDDGDLVERLLRIDPPDERSADFLNQASAEQSNSYLERP